MKQHSLPECDRRFSSLTRSDRGGLGNREQAALLSAKRRRGISSWLLSSLRGHAGVAPALRARAPELAFVIAVDAGIPQVVEAAQLLLGHESVWLMEATPEHWDIERRLTILHFSYGSEAWKAFLQGNLGERIDSASTRVILHQLGEDQAVQDEGGFISVTDLTIFGGDSDSTPAFEARQENVWRRAAALGRFYLNLHLDRTACRTLAMAIAAMDIAANAIRTQRPGRRVAPFPTRIDRALLGIPSVTVAPNEAYSIPYMADREGLYVTVHASDYLAEQPISFWPFDHESEGRVFLPRQESLADGERLQVLDDRLFDLAIGTPMVAMRRLSTGAKGFVTLDMLLTKCEGDDQDIWVGDDPDQLRAAMEFQHSVGALYSTNRLGPQEIKDSIEYLSRFEGKLDEGLEPRPHPLQFGTHGHRLGVWVLDRDRDSTERAHVVRLFAAALHSYIIPSSKEVAPGALAWPYEFAYSLSSWATELRPPWFAGYANAAMVGMLAVGWALTGEARWKELAQGAVRYLKLASEKTGAAYFIDGFQFNAEYAYRTAPIPNYRVLDGELCSPPYLHNAGLLLDNPEIVALAHRLACGLTVPLGLLRGKDGAPLLAMDGHDMTPAYMWQLWACLQLLSAMTKDRTFSRLARDWKRFIPVEFWEQGYPS